ncbi:MAG: ribosomal protein S18-alanine N-acetyltransferase [Wenzhouxiangella sp.]
MVAVMQTALEIRPMRRADLDAVMAIEHNAYPFPWSLGIFKDCLRIGYRCLVLTDSGTVCGYSVYSVAVDEAHLLNLCIASPWRRRGLASLLLDHVLQEMILAGADRAYLEVRPSNRGAIRLYGQHAFRQIGRRPGYYPHEEGREDALVMVRHLEGVHHD